MAASNSSPLHPVHTALLHNLLSDSQDFVGVMDEGDDRSRKAEEFANSESKKAKTEVFASISPTQLMDPTFHAPCTVGKVEAQVVAVAPLVRDDVADVGALVQRMAQMQQEAMQGQFQLQQNFFEQFIRMLPGILPSNAAASERVHELPVQLTTAAPSTPVDSSGLTIGEWEQAVLKPPVLEATKLDDEANKYYVKVSRKFEDYYH